MGAAPVQPASDESGTKLRGKLGSVPAWLRITLSGLLLTGVPVAVYVFQYQAGRVEAATVRNFRALDAASGRIRDVLENLSNVVANHSFNVSPAMVKEVHERMRCDRAEGCSGAVDIDRIDRALETWRNHAGTPPGNGTEDGLKTELLYEIAEFILGGEYRRRNMQVWEELRSLLDEYRRRYDETGNNTIAVDVAPAPRAATIELVERLKAMRRRSGGMCSPDRTASAQEGRACPDFDLLLRESDRSRCEPSTRLVERSGGLRVRITDCRPLRTRSPELYQALKKRHGRRERDAAETHPVLAALDLFGVRSVVDLDRMLSDATGHLSRFFDSNLIADRHGRLLFKIDDPPEFVSDMDVRRATALAFANHVDLGALLSEPVPSADVRFGDEAEPPAAAPAPAGRSIVKSHRVGNVELLVFIHPFIVNGIEAPDTDDSAAEPGAPSDRVFYMVGVTSAGNLRGEAMRLRLSWVVTATLLVLAILTLFPLLWFWTAGDRLTLSRSTLAGIVLVPAAGVVLCVVLALGIVTNHIDGNTLDDAVEAIAERMESAFDQELEQRLCDLHAAAFSLGGRRDDGGSADGKLKDFFYCGSEPPAPQPGIPPYQTAFLIDEHGRQVRCTIRRVLRTPRLDLRFREYFRRPMEGRLQYPTTGQDGGSRAPYYLERIDSIVQGQVATVLAIRADALGYADEPVAAAGIRFESLEKMALPPHVAFAVVDRETGRTLFHSDERRAMVTNFVKDVGADASLLSQLRTGTRATIDLIYDGVPIRARVAALREELPWTLVVYRDHEIEDQLGFVTSTLTLVCVFLTLWAAALLGGLAVLFCRLCGLSRSPLRDLWLRVIIDSPSPSGARRIKVSRHVGAGAVTVASIVLALTVAEWLPAGWSPFVAVGSVAIIVLTLLCSLVDRWDDPAPPAPAVTRPDTTGQHPAPGRAAAPGWQAAAVSSLPRSNPRWILVTIIAGLTIVPAAAWFTYHRVQLSTGLDRYVRDQGNEAACRKRESYRAEARNYSQTTNVKKIWTDRDFDVPGMFRHVALRDVWGTCEAVPGDRADGWAFDVLRGVVAHSTVASDLMAYRDAAGSDGHSAAPRRVFEGMSILPWKAPPFDGWLLVPTAGLLLVLAGLVGVIVQSICAAVMGRRLSRPRLPAERSGAFGVPRRPGEPLRVLARYRSRTARRKREKEAYGRFSVIHRARWTDTRVDWNPSRDENAASDRKNGELHVVEDLDAMLTNEQRQRGLLDELERLTAEGAAVLVWTRVVPGYRLSTPGDAADRAVDADRFSRWSRLLSGFELHVVRETRAEVEQSFAEGWKKTNDEALRPEDERDVVVQLMRTEAVANPDLADLAVDVASEVRVRDPQASRQAQADEHRREEALRRFQARAEAHFNMLWTQSTLDERLQLHTFALGGLVNRRRHAALASLAQRGLVHNVDGVVRLRSTAFGDFIAHDLVHDELIAWQKEGHGGVWKMIWPPVAIGAVLALVFFFQSNPEMLSTLLTIALAFLPVAVSLFRGQQNAEPISTGLEQ